MSDLSGEGATGAADSRPLTQQEYAQVQRLFSDPFSFPLQFKTWLISYLETSDLNLPISAINGLVSILGITGAGGGTLGVFPAGLIMPYAGGVAPTGSLWCDGAAYLKTTYSRLFNAIGSNFGSPDANSFNVPDLRGRVTVGAGPHPNVATLGQNEGLGPGSRQPQHLHRMDDYGWASEGITAGGDAQVHGATPGSEIGVHHHGPEGIRNDTPAYIVMNFIIVA